MSAQVIGFDYFDNNVNRKVSNFPRLLLNHNLDYSIEWTKQYIHFPKIVNIIRFFPATFSDLFPESPLLSASENVYKNSRIQYVEWIPLQKSVYQFKGVFKISGTNSR